MGRAASIVVGLGLLALGCVFALSAIATGVVAPGVVGLSLMMWGVVRLGRGVAMTDAPAHHLPPPDDPRWHAQGAQLVGRDCADCGIKIAVDGEGRWCKRCGAACHDSCFKSHRLRAHRPVTGAVYR